MILFADEIESYKMYGEINILHTKVNALIQQKQILETDEPDLVIIAEEEYVFIEYFIKNILTSKTKYFIAKTKTKDECIHLYKVMRGMGDCFMFPKEKIFIMKELKPDFKHFYRSEILLPTPDQNINEYLKLELETESLSDCELINGDNEFKILKSLTSKSPYLYIGDKIEDQYLSICKTFAKMKIKLIDCYDHNNKLIGMFVTKDYAEKAWMTKAYDIENLKQFYRFEEYYIKIFV